MNKITLKPHNQETYENLTTMLKTESRVACVQPTGTGKSYIALRYIEENSLKKILLLAPTDIILSQFRETIREIEDEVFEKFFFKNVKTAKYLDLGLEGFKDVFDVKWDTIIMDEFHRSGASTWNQFINELLKENPNAKIIGLSATPIRFLDNGRDMGLEFFENNYACYITLKEALDRGILPMPIYVCTDYRITTETSKYIREKYKYVHSKEQEQKIARRFLENGSGMHDILKKYLPNNRGNYIVFCQNSEQIKKMKPIMKAWLEPFNNNIHMYTTLSHDAEPDQPLLDFKYDQSEAIKLLFCVDRLNEGLHLSHLDGEFMLRGTDSPIIYFQQMGRVLTSSQEKRPVVFDLVNNYRSVRATIRRNVENKDREPIASFGQARDSYASYLAKEFDEMIKYDFMEDGKEFNERLDELDFDVRNENWNEMFELVKQYSNDTGSIPTKRTIYKNKNIGIWIHNQKKRKKNYTISKEQIIKLQSIGIDLETIDANDKWNKMFELLKEYHEETGQWPSQKTIYKNQFIGTWLQTQKAAYKKGKLSVIRERKFKSIGFSFSSYFDTQWDKMFKLVKQYHEETGEWPSQKTIYQNENIGHWLRNQKSKYKKGKLNKSKVKALKSIYFDLDCNREQKESIQWDKMFKLVKQYHEETGEWPIISTIYHNHKIGKWLNSQKQLFRKQALSSNRIATLKSIDYEIEKDYKEKWTTQWNKMFELLKEYHEETNEWPNKGVLYKNEKLGEWLTKQKHDYKQNRLAYNKELVLMSIGFNFNVNVHEQNWNTKYLLLKQYHEETGEWPSQKTIYKNQFIGTWLQTQKAAYKKGKLSTNQIKKLLEAEIPFRGKTYKSQWNHMFELLKQYHEETGEWPSQKITIQNLNLGTWFSHQKYLKRKQKLSKERQKKLESIGVVFEKDKQTTEKEK